MFNLLNDRLIRLKKDDNVVVSASLAEVYASLMNDKVVSFPALRPHQRHAWHAFLVQLGGIALHNAGIGEPPKDAETWLSILSSLTADYPGGEPWHLVVENITMPAFMQPPASSKEKFGDYKSIVVSPDAIDMLVTSKNHDLKANVAFLSHFDDWIFALISLQTSEGLFGFGNYGISRMNGGFGCRPAVSLTPSMRPGAHARRDMQALLKNRQRLLEEYGPFLSERGIDLLWIRGWDGTKSEMLSSSLDPFYIEICRRIRLMELSNGRLVAVKATSKAARIDSKGNKGITGDPWTPISQRDGKSLTLSPVGFRYRRTAEYLSSDWEKPVLFGPQNMEKTSMTLVARGIARGQGATAGYHERTIEFSPKVIATIGRPGGADQIGKISGERIEDTRRLHRILWHSISVINSDIVSARVSHQSRAHANIWVSRHDDIVDRDFFNDLQEELEADDIEQRRSVRNSWRRKIIGDARAILRQADGTLMCSAIQRYRGSARAEDVFEGRLRNKNGFPELYSDEERDEASGI